MSPVGHPPPIPLPPTPPHIQLEKPVNVFGQLVFFIFSWQSFLFLSAAVAAAATASPAGRIFRSRRCRNNCAAKWKALRIPLLPPPVPAWPWLLTRNHWWIIVCAFCDVCRFCVSHKLQILKKTFVWSAVKTEEDNLQDVLINNGEICMKCMPCLYVICTICS